MQIASDENKKMFLDVMNGGGEFLGTDQHGNEWFHKMNDDGTQTWVSARDGKVLDAGVNQKDKIRTYNPVTGLSRPEKPTKNSIVKKKK